MKGLDLAIDKVEKGLGLTPHRSMTKVTPTELLS